MAGNFLRKVNAGEDATEEGLLLARQMQGASRFGGYVLGGPADGPCTAHPGIAE